MSSNLCFSPFIVFSPVILFYAAQMVPFKDEMKITQVPVVVAVSHFINIGHEARIYTIY